MSFLEAALETTRSQKMKDTIQISISLHQNYFDLSRRHRKVPEVCRLVLEGFGDTDHVRPVCEGGITRFLM